MAGSTRAARRALRIAARTALCAAFALLSFALLSFAQAPQTSSAPQQQPTAKIQVSVDRVNVGVVVTDAGGKFVEKLTREDFHVFDSGVEQAITDFSTVDAPATVLLLIESGPAVYFQENSHVEAAYGLLNGLSAGDRAGVVAYTNQAQGVLDFTTDKNAVAGSFNRLRFNLGFDSLNLSSSLNTVLDWLGKVEGKKSVVLLSTGLDTSPEGSANAILGRLQTGDVRVYCVSLAQELLSSPDPKKKKQSEKAATVRAGVQQSDRFLEAIASTSGGRAYFPRNAQEFGQAYTQIAELVRHEYSLAFAPPVSDGKTHRIEVRLDAGRNPLAGNYVETYRRAYIAPAPQ